LPINEPNLIIFSDIYLPDMQALSSNDSM